MRSATWSSRWYGPVCLSIRDIGIDHHLPEQIRTFRPGVVASKIWFPHQEVRAPDRQLTSALGTCRTSPTWVASSRSLQPLFCCICETVPAPGAGITGSAAKFQQQSREGSLLTGWPSMVGTSSAPRVATELPASRQAIELATSAGSGTLPQTAWSCSGPGRKAFQGGS